MTFSKASTLVVQLLCWQHIIKYQRGINLGSAAMNSWTYPRSSATLSVLPELEADGVSWLSLAS